MWAWAASVCSGHRCLVGHWSWCQVTDAEVQRPRADLVSFSLRAHSSSSNGISALLEGSTRARSTGAGCWQGLGHTGMVQTTQTAPGSFQPDASAPAMSIQTQYQAWASFLKTMHSLQQTKPSPWGRAPWNKRVYCGCLLRARVHAVVVTGNWLKPQAFFRFFPPPCFQE